MRPAVDVRGRKGIGGHTRPGAGATVEWYTPPGLFTAIGLEFALDPCAPEGGLPWIPAHRFYSEADDGLTAPWSGRVWLNPPYGPHTGTWMRRLSAHGHGIGLVFARTETEWWHDVAPTAHAICFIRGRLTFVDADRQPGAGNAGGPSALMAWGEECAAAIAESGLGMTFAIRSRELLGQASLWERAS